MAVEAYTGNPGGGKTYEVVKSVICPAIARGQRVVTNIRGLNYDVIGKHLGVPPGRVAQLIKTFDERDVYDVRTGLIKESFFPSSGNDDGTLEWGAYNVIDEAWKYCGTGTKLDERAKQFFRMHRHETYDGFSTQICIITQKVEDLTSFVRNVVDQTTRCIKKTAYGNHKAYWCRKFQGATDAPTKALNEVSYKYEEPYISMYQTQRGKVAEEKGVDTRGSIWNNRKLQLAAVAVVVLAGVIVFQLVTMNDKLGRAANTLPGRAAALAAPGAQSQGGTQCRTAIALVEISPYGMEQPYIMAKGQLVPVTPNTVYGQGSQRFSTVCP